MSDPVIGKKYFMRVFPGVPDLELHKVKVIRITTLGDGTRIVSFRHNWPFPLTTEMEMSKFLENTEVIE